MNRALRTYAANQKQPFSSHQRATPRSRPSALRIIARGSISAQAHESTERLERTAVSPIATTVMLAATLLSAYPGPIDCNFHVDHVGNIITCGMRCTPFSHKALGEPRHARACARY